MTADPGWRPVLRSIYYALFPQLAIWGSKLRKLDGLSSLRLLAISFAGPLLLILWVVARQGLSADADLSVTAALLLVAGLGLAGYFGLTFFLRKTPEVATDDEAAGYYRSRALGILAFANGMALVGFVFVFLSASPIPFYGGLIVAAPAMFLAMPTATSLQRQQAEFGDDIDLVGGLVALRPRSLWARSH